MKGLLTRFNQLCFAHASGVKVLLLLALTIMSFVLMAFVITPAFQDATGGLRPFDLNFGIGAEMIYRDLPVYTNQSRGIYIWFAIVDYIYPVALAAFFTLLWAWLFNKSPNRLFDQLTSYGILLVPFLFALVDWSENAGFLFVIFSYPTEHRTIADLAGALKTTKPMIELAVLILTAIFSVVAIRHRRRS